MGTLAEVLSNPLGVVEWFVYLLAAVLFVVGLHMMNSPKTARKGNLISAPPWMNSIGIVACFSCSTHEASWKPYPARRRAIAPIVVTIGLARNFGR